MLVIISFLIDDHQWKNYQNSVQTLHISVIYMYENSSINTQFNLAETEPQNFQNKNNKLIQMQYKNSDTDRDNPLMNSFLNLTKF